MQSTRFKISWRDIGKALVLTLIGNILVLIMGLPEDQLPTWLMIKTNLILSIKLVFIPYLIKNFFTDDVKVAEKVLDKAAKVSPAAPNDMELKN
jgi:hypothetical protein